MERYPRVYDLSERNGPPRINLRQGQIRDDYGDDTWATLPISHREPRDVTRKELDHYPWVYCFLEFRDLLFYLYPTALEYERNPNCDFIHSFLYSLDNELYGGLKSLDESDRDALKAGLVWIWSDWGSGYAPWSQCRGLCDFIGIEVG